jgi:ATP-binding cassette subfamily B protein
MIAPVTVLGVVLGFGALFVGLDWMAPVDVLPFALVAPGICAPVLLLHTLLHDLGSAAGAAQRVQALLETPVLEPLAPGQEQIPEGHEVRFESVGYSYGGERRTLSGISFTLEPGTVTAIVGPSGAGKSTLARLLLRFFDPDEGRITLGGADLRRIASAQLYRRVGFVLQEVRLIHASVRDNIALGRPSATRARARRGHGGGRRRQRGGGPGRVVALRPGAHGDGDRAPAGYGDARRPHSGRRGRRRRRTRPA